MILSELKLRLAGRFIYPETAIQKPNDSAREIRNITVVLDSRDALLFNRFSEIRTNNGLNDKDFSIITCADPKDKEDGNLNFSVADVSWTGRIRKQQLREFFDCRHSIIIGFSRNTGRAMEFLIRNSKADLKIGRGENSTGIYDLEIFSRYEEVDVFIKEVEKYLRILKYKS